MTHASKLVNLRIPPEMIALWEEQIAALPKRVPFAAYMRRAANTYASLLAHERKGGSFIVVKPNGKQVEHRFTPEEKFDA